MTQTLKPDRPIWPSVPDTLAPPDTEAGGDAAAQRVPKREVAPIERPEPDAAPPAPGAFEGFGSFSR
ncbi:hypothetical protein [Methylobacterium sp. J-068]|uniref:hypothetical protein n=1 Tax=Methylobacterium sp. J-068 TaxID=2836649 RepID=UPI001FBA1C4D|nr:hypothetical protein [Methylobacterium sp. J-068]MCJ2036217.1 hypothetical protein [Methylobacterium sp. J-068]